MESVDDEEDVVGGGMPSDMWAAIINSHNSQMQQQQQQSRHTTPIIGTKRLDRPKSVPASLRAGRRSDGIITQQGARRPQTALGTERNNCDRLQELEHEVTRKHNLDPHLPLKRPKPPPWQKTLDVSPSPCVVTPGYVLSRSKNRVAMVIKTDEFFESDQPEKEAKPTPERDSLITELQNQIDDLTLFLEEERLNHKDTKRKAAELLKDKVEDINKQHQNEIRYLHEQHEEMISQIQEDFEKQMQIRDEHNEAVINKMRTEVEFLQGAFESYKSQLHQQTDDRWNKRESDLQLQHEELMQKKFHELRSKVIAEKNADRAELEKSHLKEIQDLRKEHKRDMDALLRRFSNAAADMKRLKEVEQELDATKRELNETQSGYDDMCKQVAEHARELTETKVKLLSYEEHFQEKVQQIDDKYKGQIHELMSQNTDLRRMYVQKCGELYDEKEQSDVKREEQLQTAKDAMRIVIQTRNRTSVNLAATDPKYDSNHRSPKYRPTSAPSTRAETHSATISASQTDDFRSKQEVKKSNWREGPKSLIISEDSGMKEEESVCLNANDMAQFMLENRY